MAWNCLHLRKLLVEHLRTIISYCQIDLHGSHQLMLVLKIYWIIYLKFGQTLWRYVARRMFDLEQHQMYRLQSRGKWLRKSCDRTFWFCTELRILTLNFFLAWLSGVVVVKENTLAICLQYFLIISLCTIKTVSSN